MSSELLSNFTRQMIAAQPGNQVVFSWQGGEPILMGLSFYEEAVRLQQAFAPETMQVSNILQTNGTLITPEWCEFFKANNFLIGLSLDGPAELHNAFRRDKQGKGSFDQVMRGVQLLNRYGVDFNILCCVHQANASHPLEVYRFLRDEVGVQFIQFIPIVSKQLDQNGMETANILENSVGGAIYGKFLNAVFDEWVHHDVGSVFVQIFDTALGVYVGQTANLCIFSEICGRALVIEHNGDLYSCDHFVNPDYLLGNITEMLLVDLVDSDRQKLFGKNKRDLLPEKCLPCDVRFLCNGGCPKNRDKSGLNYLCEGYQSFFRHINHPMDIMVNLLWKKRSPSDVMKIID